MSCFQTAAIILAAGEARRMGTLKQLLPYGAGTLLTHTIGTVVDARFSPVVVVVGAEAAVVQATLAAQPVEVAFNGDWQKGMGSSIRVGIEHVRTVAPEVGAVAVVTGDQPRVESAHLRGMRDMLIRSEADVVAAQYGGTLGVPAVFKRRLFARLAALDARGGAKALLQAEDVRAIAFSMEEAAFDIDTPEDLATLRASEGHPR